MKRKNFPGRKQKRKESAAKRQDLTKVWAVAPIHNPQKRTMIGTYEECLEHINFFDPYRGFSTIRYIG